MVNTVGPLRAPGSTSSTSVSSGRSSRLRSHHLDICAGQGGTSTHCWLCCEGHALQSQALRPAGAAAARGTVLLAHLGCCKLHDPDQQVRFQQRQQQVANAVAD